MKIILEILIERLVKKGIKFDSIPAYIRDMTNANTNTRPLSRKALNRQMKLLGWDDFELDEHTLQLVIANIETRTLSDLSHLNPIYLGFDLFEKWKNQLPVYQH